MTRSEHGIGKVLVTGGTSGLGLALTKNFLENGCDVVATGRKDITLPGYKGRFTLLRTDFSNLKLTSEAVRSLCRNQRFDIVVNNAGVLSPPDLQLSDEGFEYTLQVNFLSHLLLSEIIIMNSDPGRPLMIASVVSPVYRIAENDLRLHKPPEEYGPLKAYSASKLFLALMGSYLTGKYPAYSLKCIGFDPGTFSSGIYRMQKEWFRIMYRIAAPFMRSPEKVAARFGDVITRKDLVDGAVYRSGTGKGSLPVAETSALNAFWKECEKILEDYIS
jgi:NAD(P)-dependent dehydrogenase (short-subunit alcohol dehydrogenase family)